MRVKMRATGSPSEREELEVTSFGTAIGAARVVLALVTSVLIVLFATVQMVADLPRVKRARCRLASKSRCRIARRRRRVAWAGTSRRVAAAQEKLVGHGDAPTSASTWYGRAVMRRATILIAAFGALALGAAPGLASSSANRLTLTASNVNGPVGAVITGTTWSVDGALSHFVAGQKIVVHAFDNGKLILSTRVALTRAGFHVAIKVAAVGRVTVRAIHYASGRLPFLVSGDVGVWVVAPTAAPNERSYSVRILQAQLAALHYVVGVPGVLDDRTQRAVLAFRKMVGLPRTMVADATVFSALAAGEGAFPVQFASHGRHVEGDLTHQVLALIGADGAVQALYPMSSGKPSTPTAPGNFHVTWQQPGVNNVGMVDSSYFNGGDAIHGYPEVPPYNASHGCLRVPIPDAPTIYAWVRIGTPVDVYFR